MTCNEVGRVFSSWDAVLLRLCLLRHLPQSHRMTMLPGSRWLVASLQLQMSWVYSEKNAYPADFSGKPFASN